MTAWDLAVVGAGPAGAATALGALRVNPALRVALLDRADFPRDKSCGDGIAPQVIDLLDEAGVSGIVNDRVPVPRLRLDRGSFGVDRKMTRPTWVVPRTVFDQRLVRAAQTAGATLVRHRVRRLVQGSTLILDDEVEARTLVGADGAHSVIRRALGLDPGPMAVAIRGYSPTPASRSGQQVIVFDTARQPAYAWSFDRGDGLSNVGYGELLDHRRDGPTRAQMLERLDTLLPGATDGGTDWKGHQLPLSTGRWRPPAGRVMLVGDAAGLVNPMTGEGIYYAVATGLAAGRAAARALAAGDPTTAGARCASAIQPLLGGHLRHVAVAAWLCRHGSVIDAGLRASAVDQRVFDDLVELGLANGRITTAMARGLVRELAGASRSRGLRRRRNDTEESPA
ncbi:geranylgeranyl reductase family protein [Nocardioides sp. JQ2195]|uniref:geranylgeranyl reductase family protein n=1 Tax=Nocardioides sp. JQ2195 TaxID=2592334 RepID=UPI00143EB419|nr:geranylgeranyl reductase family protein [Nocardioides sp. JQ2195]QIX27172.1 geranylgeranyl reductase family protein [Nocardioides sp. JQ2195]